MHFLFNIEQKVLSSQYMPRDTADKYAFTRIWNMERWRMNEEEMQTE